MAPHRGASGRAISVYPTPWPPTCSGVLPSWCTIEVAVLLVVTEEAAILDVLGRALAIRAPPSAEESVGITPRERGSDSSGIREATQCTTRHSWPNALFLLRGQMVAYYHGWATVPRRERAATSPHRPAMRLEMAVFAWEHMMREQAAYH